jgi:hypothetical protein
MYNKTGLKLAQAVAKMKLHHMGLIRMTPEKSQKTLRSAFKLAEKSKQPNAWLDKILFSLFTRRKYYD